jgi:hypothetical protein
MSTAWNSAAVEHLRALDHRVAEVFRLRCISGKSEDEIAKTLGVTARTVRRDFEKARFLLAGRRFDPPKDGEEELIGSPMPPKPSAPLTSYEEEPGDDQESE